VVAALPVALVGVEASGRNVARALGPLVGELVEGKVRFYLGTHHPGWIGRVEVPLFVSARRLRRRKTVPRTAGLLAIDSGAFTELTLHGRWTVSPEQYAEEGRTWHSQAGGVQFLAPQDWPSEPSMRQKTSLSVQEHQRRTVSNYLDLLRLAPDLPWMPVLQGWEHQDYLAHVEMYRSEGIDLASLPLVGLGSVCRRQATGMAEDLIRELHARGLRLHGFGFKVGGLRRVARWLASADSMAWSFAARRSKPLPGCTHRSCANCQRYALRWHSRVSSLVERARVGPVQRLLW
jgi:hypothetical protein